MKESGEGEGKGGSAIRGSDERVWLCGEERQGHNGEALQAAPCPGLLASREPPAPAQPRRGSWRGRPFVREVTQPGGDRPRKDVLLLCAFQP